MLVFIQAILHLNQMIIALKIETCSICIVPIGSVTQKENVGGHDFLNQCMSAISHLNQVALALVLTKSIVFVFSL